MTLHLIDHIAFFFLAVAYPIWGYFYIRKQRALINAGGTELRIKLYRRTIGEEWVMALVLLGSWFALGRRGAAIGLVPQKGLLVWAAREERKALTRLWTRFRRKPWRYFESSHL